MNIKEIIKNGKVENLEQLVLFYDNCHDIEFFDCGVYSFYDIQIRSDKFIFEISISEEVYNYLYNGYDDFENYVYDFEFPYCIKYYCYFDEEQSYIQFTNYKDFVQHCL